MTIGMSMESNGFAEKLFTALDRKFNIKKTSIMREGASFVLVADIK